MTASLDHACSIATAAVGAVGPGVVPCQEVCPTAAPRASEDQRGTHAALAGPVSRFLQPCQGDDPPRVVSRGRCWSSGGGLRCVAPLIMHHSGERSIVPSATTCAANVLAQRYVGPDVCYVRKSKGHADPSAAPNSSRTTPWPGLQQHSCMMLSTVPMTPTMDPCESKPCNVGPIFQLGNLEAQRVAR